MYSLVFENVEDRGKAKSISDSFSAKMGELLAGEVSAYTVPFDTAAWKSVQAPITELVGQVSLLSCFDLLTRNPSATFRPSPKSYSSDSEQYSIMPSTMSKGPPNATEADGA